MSARFKPAHARRRSPEAQAKLNRAEEKKQRIAGKPTSKRTSTHGSHQKSLLPSQVNEENRLLFQRAKKLRASKRFSQNFLISGEYLHAIATHATVPELPLPIVEIGPGCGFLTERLLQLSHQPTVTAIELDRRMIEFLETTLLPQTQGRLAIISGDVLKTEWDKPLPLIDTPEALETSLAPFTLAGNLPYAISAPILLMLAGELSQGHQAHPLRTRLKKAVLMLQKEVAEKVVASPHSKAWGTLAMTMQQWFETTWVTEVPPQAFYPAPKVTSAVVALTPRKTPRCVPTLDGYSEACMLLWLECVIHAGCQQKRKTLLNNWKAYLLETLEGSAKKYGWTCEWLQGKRPDVSSLIQPLLEATPLLRAESCDWDAWETWTCQLVRTLSPWVKLTPTQTPLLSGTP